MGYRHPSVDGGRLRSVFTREFNVVFMLFGVCGGFCGNIHIYMVQFCKI